ncbi:MAG: hypothetical protein KatS3mg114_1151 [Planctomycetaceae bacterium]|nr:MAG: hypothetical protein KatS3mg114_1151 [Planctomycetaceae bacterium]
MRNFIMIIVVLAILLLALFWWRGTGGGISSGTSHTMALVPNESETPPPEQSTPPPQPTATAIPSQPLKLVLCDRDVYWQKESTWERLSLDQLITLLKAISPDEDGLRAKIYRCASARASLEEQLKAACRDAQLSLDSLYWSPEIVPDPPRTP